MSTVSCGLTSKHQCYYGKSRKFIIGFDIGTITSSLSYAILCPEESPEVVSVIPDDVFDKAAASIPSIICYDRHGTAQAFGHEAAHMNEDLLADHEWIKVDK